MVCGAGIFGCQYGSSDFGAFISGGGIYCISCVLCICFAGVSDTSCAFDGISGVSAFSAGAWLCDPGSSDHVWSAFSLSGADPSGTDRCTGGSDPDELRGYMLLYTEVYYHGDRNCNGGQHGAV